MMRASMIMFSLVAVICVGIDARPAAGQPSAREVLERLDGSERANAVIELEHRVDTDDATVQRIGEVGSLWNEGRYAEALAALSDLESEGIAPAVGIAWKEPVPSRSPDWYPDVAIGGGRTGYEDAAIGHDPASGNIFVMIQWADGWSTNISTDLGASFSETYFWSTHALADMTVVGEHAWVGYAGGGSSSGTVRMRRFHIADGSPDGAYSWVEIANIDPDIVLDLVVDGNAPDTNNRVYVVYSNYGDGSITFLYDDLTGTSFTSIPTGIILAWYGLDFSWNPYPDSPTEGNFWISYIDSGPSVQVYTNHSTFLFHNEASQPFTGSVRETGVSARAGKVYCVYEKDNGSGQNGVAFLSTANAGSVWTTSDVFVPDPGAAEVKRPNVTVRSGKVPAVIFTTDETTTDLVWHTQREAMSYGQWSAPFSFSNYNASVGTPTEIEWLDVSCVRSHGMVYGDDAGVPYFDLMTPRCFFGDGFESGDTSVWSTTIP